MALDELLAQASEAALADVTDLDELAALQAELEAAGMALAESEQMTDDVLADLDRIATALDAVRARAVDVQAADADRASRAADLVERIRGQVEDESEGDDDDGENGDAADDDADTDDEGVEEEPEVETEEAGGELVEVAAAARPAPRIGRVAARRPAGLPQTRAELEPKFGDMPANVADWGLVASAEAKGITPGQQVRTREQLADLWLGQLDASANYRGPRTKFPAIRMGNPDALQLYGPNRYLGRDEIANSRVIDKVVGPQALAASGGKCAPAQVNYDMPVIGTDARPVRNDLMARFGADRGGVRTFPVPTLALIEALSPAAVDIWTEANDVTPSDPTTKPCAVMTCPQEDDTDVEAITLCLEVGEFRRRFFMEQVEAWMRLIAIHHARTAETRLLTSIGDGSTAVTVGQGMGATRDLLAGLDRALAAFTSRHRAPGTTWRWGAPFWLLNMIRTDLAREMPGSAEERLAMADAAILAIFRVHGVTPTFFLDGETGQIFGAQGDGPLLGWPSTVVTYLYPEGSWLFLDGGTYEAGWFRDSGLIETNDARFFSETFEGAHFHGVESYRLTFDVCPDGSSGGTSDFDPCATGS